MPSAGFEHAIRTVCLQQNYALDRNSTMCMNQDIYIKNPEVSDLPRSVQQYVVFLKISSWFFLLSLSLHSAFRGVIELAHQLMHIHNIFYIKTLQISECF